MLNWWSSTYKEGMNVSSTPLPDSAITTAPLVHLNQVYVSYSRGIRRRAAAYSERPAGVANPGLVLAGVEMRVYPGEIYGLLGLNGAGKSTLMNAIMGVVSYSGTIFIAGEPWRPDHLDHIGASINGPAFYPHLSAYRNLLVHARLTGTDPGRIEEVLTTVGLHAGNKAARSYSTGMKVRLAMAMALLTDPAILLLDEPTNGLDPEAIVGLRTVLRNLADSGKAVVVSSHYLGEVAKTADRIGVLTQGQLAYEGPLASFASAGQSLEEAFFTRVGVQP